ncbi:GMC family oxidoreductase [Thermoleophilia bacterium SCSIO 60948]|nr:GMC family oxidoreductase [Thermoleophilia bacterium SCSIO 60948]
MAPRRGFDFDWLVIGSGFGGSASALRLAQKGYSVGVLECGRRFEDEDFPDTTWDVRKYYWLPRLGMKGILRMTLFKDIFIVSGCGVGGGSLGYANTLYRPRRGSAFYRDRQWSELDEWERTLAPHYDTAERMLGVTTYEGEGAADRLLMELADELGVRDTYTTTRVGVFFGEPGATVPDPYFGGEGPARAGCLRVGRCMLGCPHNAKNTLMKNYLWFAERKGARIMPERTVVEVRPLGKPDGSDGYRVLSERSGAWLRKDRQEHTARGVVVAAGALGTNTLLRRCKDRGALPRLSDRLGYLVRTNSEAISAVTRKDDRVDFSDSIAISSSIHPDADTHIENVTYGRGADSMSLLFTLLTPNGSALTRPLKAVAGALRHPLTFARITWPRAWSRRTVILLTMQTLDNSMRLVPKRNLLGLGPRLQTREDPDKPNPRFIDAANGATKRAAEKLDGIPQSGITEALLNVPTTAHIMGGAVIGASRENGVIDARQRVFGYENLLVCDGSAVPANIGVNPSLTITALAEHAMSHIAAAQSAAPTTGERVAAT